jgi:hypothetical protein
MFTASPISIALVTGPSGGLVSAAKSCCQRSARTRFAKTSTTNDGISHQAFASRSESHTSCGCAPRIAM